MGVWEQDQPVEEAMESVLEMVQVAVLEVEVSTLDQEWEAILA